MRMTSLDTAMMDMVPDYRAILTTVLKTQILTLVEQLSTQTGEETIILTANIPDKTFCHLGSHDGKDFLDDKDDIKTDFLRHCLSKHRLKPSEVVSPTQHIHDNGLHRDTHKQTPTINRTRKRRKVSSQQSKNCKSSKKRNIENTTMLQSLNQTDVSEKEMPGENVRKMEPCILGNDLELRKSRLKSTQGQVISSGGQVILSEGQVISSQCQVISSRGQDFSSEGQVISSHCQVISSQNQRDLVPDINDEDCDTSDYDLDTEGHDSSIYGDMDMSKVNRSQHLNKTSPTNNDCILDLNHVNKVQNVESSRKNLSKNLDTEPDLDLSNKGQNDTSESQSSCRKLDKLGRVNTGQSVSEDIRVSVILKVIENGGDESTGYVPRGTFSKVCSSHGIHSSTVSRMWQRYVTQQAVQHEKHT